ncbi:Xanthine/uracil permease [Cystobasidium minutum MCA 4210]|uniref:Xanthine/uracil permease n=1 Tax=Cystobasidium minutum MCA 4210 TaxID=1397322 RepID=UPI0034CE65FA|eukprot:jgi/Rhomi1/47137/CE47136_1979
MGKDDFGLDEIEELQNSSVSLPSPSSIKRKLTTKEGWIGDFDFAFLCTPTLNPWSKKSRSKTASSTPYYGVTDDLPILLALVCGFQHSLAMLAGVITPPTIFASSLGLSGTPYANYMVASSLIASGICSAIQMTRFKIPFSERFFTIPRYMGTGLITVTGTSFATLSTASAIFNALYSNGTCPMVTASDGVTVVRGACPDAYGYVLGTSALCSLLMMGLSFVPPKALKRIFPPGVTGLVVLLIGASLIGESGFLNWAGGSGTCHNRPETGLFALCPNINAPKPLPWGSAQFIGLGFLSFVTIILVELFGSPFMRNASIIMGLIVGMIVAGGAGYVDGTSIKTAPVATFFWVHTFKLRIYAPAILPMMAVYVSLTMEVIGDITASSEASRQPVSGLLYDSRISGGILADGVNGLLSALFTNAPLSIFAQNNGVISITRCANRTAGYFCAALMVLYGVLAKISGVFLAIPASVLGGITTFLFASVCVSGLKVISMSPLTRRNRIVLASGFSLGMGNIVVDDWAAYIFTYEGGNSALKGFMDAIVIILSTPFLIAAIVSIIVNLILPADDEDEVVSRQAVAPEAYPVDRTTTSVLPQHRSSETGIEEEAYTDKEDRLTKVEV